MCVSQNRGFLLGPRGSQQETNLRSQWPLLKPPKAAIVSMETGEIQSPVQFASLPEFMNFKLVGKTILVENTKFERFLGHPLSK